MVFPIIEQYTNTECTDYAEQVNLYYVIIITLDIAIRNNDTKKITDLLCDGIVDLTTALARSVLNDNIGIVELLLYLFDADPIQALMFSVYYNNIHMAQYLLNSGVNPNESDQNGKYPLIVASVITKNVEMVELLLKCGAVPSLKNRSGKTLIEVVENEKIKNLLIEQENKFKDEMERLITWTPQNTL